MIKELQEIYEEFQLFHSTYQIENFIIGNSSNVNAYARYKQATREVFSRYKAIKDTYLALIEKELDLDEIRDKDLLFNTGTNEIDNISRKRTKIKEYKLHSDIEDLTKKLEDLKREFILFINILFTYREIIKDKDVQELDHEMWVDAVLEKAIKDITTQGVVSAKTVDFAYSLNPADRAKVVPLIQDQSKMLSWFKEKEDEMKQITIKEYPEIASRLLSDAKQDIPGIEYVKNIQE